VLVIVSYCISGLLDAARDDQGTGPRMQCSLTSGSPFHLAIHDYIPGLLHLLQLLLCTTLTSSCSYSCPYLLLAAAGICTHITLQKGTAFRHYVSAGVSGVSSIHTFKASIVSKFNGCVTGVTLVRTCLPPTRDRGMATCLNTMPSWSQTNALFLCAKEVVGTSEVKTEDDKTWSWARR
jgi:hypothetical protein